MLDNVFQQPLTVGTTSGARVSRQDAVRLRVVPVMPMKSIELVATIGHDDTQFNGRIDQSGGAVCA
jgi:hypothetical protein